MLARNDAASAHCAHCRSQIGDWNLSDMQVAGCRTAAGSWQLRHATHDTLRMTRPWKLVMGHDGTLAVSHAICYHNHMPYSIMLFL
jgi:hypothetical protein